MHNPVAVSNGVKESIRIGNNERQCYRLGFIHLRLSSQRPAGSEARTSIIQRSYIWYAEALNFQLIAHVLMLYTYLGRRQ